MEASRGFASPAVHEAIVFREKEPKDDFGYPQLAGEVGLEPTTSALTEQRTTDCPTLQRVLFHYKLGWHNNDVDWLDVANKIEPVKYDYTKQLKFHQQELRRFVTQEVVPLAMVNYHSGRIDLLEGLGYGE